MPYSATLSYPSSLSTLDEELQDLRPPYGRMLTIRQDQVAAFERYQLRKFEDEMVEHLKEFAPRHWKVIGEQTGRAVIQLGIKQAEKYGFTNRGPVRFYVEMMLLFGSFFDTDPQYPWIAEILNDPEDMDEMFRADWLHDTVMEYWDAVAGPENAFTLAAVRNLSEMNLKDYSDPSKSLEDCLLGALNRTYPQKCEYLGEAPLRALLRRTFELAHQHGFKSTEEIFLLTALTFFLGHEFAWDPLHGRIRRRLAETARSGVGERNAGLRNEATVYLYNILGGDEEPS